MKVLLLNASPKRTGATQEILTIISEQMPAHAEVKTVCLGDLHLEFCRGCKSCYDTCTCVLRDDVSALIGSIDEADAVVIAAPSYWADVPGQFKTFIDRCTPYSDTNPNPNRRVLRPNKRCYAIALRTGTRPIECAHIIETIAHWCGHMGIAMADSLFFCGINGKEDIRQQQASLEEKAREWFAE